MSKIRLEYISQAALGEPTLLASVEVNIGARTPDKHTMENGLRALLLAATYHPDTVDGIFAPAPPLFSQEQLRVIEAALTESQDHYASPAADKCFGPILQIIRENLEE